MRFSKGLSLIGIITSVAIITSFLGTYFFLQKQIEKQTNEDDKDVRGQLLVSEALEIVQGIKTANILQCRKTYDQAINNTISDSPSEVASSSVCTDWDKGFANIKDSGSGQVKRVVLDNNTSLQEPMSGANREIKSTTCVEANSNPSCTLKRKTSDGYYHPNLDGRPSGGGDTDFRRFVKLKDTGEDQLQATSYVFLKNRFGNSYGNPDGSANFVSSIRLYNTDL